MQNILSCKMVAIDSFEVRCKPDFPNLYNEGIRKIRLGKSRNFTAEIAGRIFKGEERYREGFGLKFTLKNEFVFKTMMKCPSQSSTPASKIMLLKKSLYENPKEALGKMINWYVETFGPATFEVCLIDVCAHITGYDFSYSKDHDRFFGLYRMKRGFIEINQYYQTIFTGFKIGSSESRFVHARIYDKLHEVRINKSFDPTPYYNSTILGERVWCIEFSFRDKFLVSHGFTATHQIWDKSKELWNYGVNKWLIHTVSNNDRKQPSVLWDWVSQLWGDIPDTVRKPKHHRSNSHLTLNNSLTKIKKEYSALSKKISVEDKDFFQNQIIGHINASNNKGVKDE
jgi:hypothetical protein